jgi:hydroxyacylglutathione hydrolase
MLLKYFYDSALAQASYLVACQASGEALVIDPARDISPYLQEAKRNGLKIVGAAETHIHADFVSGARELAERGATLYLSDCAEEPWKYHYVDRYPHRLLRDGHHFMIGNLRFDVLHTPGHTPEHVSYLLTDTPATPEPIGMFTGDFVFVGSVGRPDLLEKAVGEANSAIKGAKQMYASVQRFRTLPDYLQVLPGHGAGSACGKGLGAVPSSTVGYEKIANPFLREQDEGRFVEQLLEGQPEPPTYFATMKRVNREGARLLADVAPPAVLEVEALLQVTQEGEMVVDTRPASQFAEAHLRGTINIPLSSLAEWGGWLLPYDQPIYLIVAEGAETEALHPLRAIGFDNIVGIADSALLQQARSQGIILQSYAEIEAQQAAEMLEAGEITLIDVRSQSEWNEKRLPHARHVMLGTLPRRLDEIPTDKPIVLQCRSGNRSAIAASILQAHGIPSVLNLIGGIQAWEKEKLPIANGSGAPH